MSNNITTLGYFKKRLRDSGYVVEELYRNYGSMDPREWSVVIDPRCASVFCTCYRNDPNLGESYFEIYDGGQFIKPGRVKIKTNSIEVFISYLVTYQINNKSVNYNSDTPYVRENKPRYNTDRNTDRKPYYKK
jgi:hypothetical protein